MKRLVLIRPGSTDFDDQGRITGTLDIPLSTQGAGQVARTVGQLAGLGIETVYTAPSEAARQTARAIAEALGVKMKHLDKLQNLDQGLWQGKLIEEVRHTQPKVYRRWQEHPETVCPPEGETLDSARRRVEAVLGKLLRKHKNGGVVALVAPEPLASLVRCHLSHTELGDLWKAERENGNYEVIDIELKTPIHSG